MKKLFYAIGVMALAVGMTACDGNNPNNQDKKIENGSQEAVDAACTQWKVSRQYWEWSEAFLFGPATTYGIDPHTDTWPFAKTQFEKLMLTYNPATDEDDADFIDNYIATGQNVAGFHAVEYLLFREGQPRKVSDFTEDEVYYACAAAKDLHLAALKLLSAWGDDLSAEEQAILEDAEWEAEYDYAAGSFLRLTGTQAAVQIIEGCRDIIGEVSEGKIGSAYTGEDINYIESPHAYNSIQDFTDNILSCRHALYGALEADKPQANSLIAYTSAVAAMQEQSKKVEDALAEAIAKVRAMKAPFVLNYTDASCGEAIEALDALDEELQKLEELLQQYAESDVQNNALKTTAEQFYRQVVLPTYRGLANSGKKLAEDVQKIAPATEQ
ncbi:MAG: hypothetical protein IJ609_02515 [Paludibacteraceae bacterium]|nr:hypothetical protein [Paludibacteraceae bacterium]MBR1480786.1 hypothetical protein [Paludibacteraceae bacterium]